MFTTYGGRSETVGSLRKRLFQGAICFASCFQEFSSSLYGPHGRLDITTQRRLTTTLMVRTQMQNILSVDKPA